MNWWIVSFLALGAVFGQLTYSRRYLFSEGTTRNTGTQSRDALDGRAIWIVLCIGLWPIFTVTGLYSLWRRSRKTRLARSPGPTDRRS